MSTGVLITDTLADALTSGGTARAHPLRCVYESGARLGPAGVLPLLGGVAGVLCASAGLPQACLRG